ncbi:release factor glutamine methyltransferase [Prauserella isguenensis]|uniref:peptide chain release factor N(5)-glutamine methyltransferase n=1 Tax=Prauserella isguenensis TaxID=1470180 RepID=A0A839S2H0_9PSEU|nr:release factor glutamine methyltransferase [Prauserella isguenensis]
MPPSPIVSSLRNAGCVFAEDEAALLIETAADGADLDRLVARRVGGEPLEYVLGWAEFRGLRVVVEPGVFVPRQRTGFLVQQALAVLPDGGVVVDLCCGSGALGAAIGAERPDATVHAADLDPVAVRCACRNLTGRVYEGDLFAALPPELRGGVDVVVANVPYVPSGAIASMPPEARDHEPAIALDGGVDGLDTLRTLAREAPSWLAAGGHLLSETSKQQAEAASAALADAGLAPRVERCEELGATVVVGRAAHDRQDAGRS